MKRTAPLPLRLNSDNFLFRLVAVLLLLIMLFTLLGAGVAPAPPEVEAVAEPERDNPIDIAGEESLDLGYGMEVEETADAAEEHLGDFAVTPVPALVTVLDEGDEPEGTEVFWNPMYGNDANDGLTPGTAVLTFAQALDLADEYAYINLTAQYQVNSDVTLDGGAGRGIRIRQYGLPGEGISVYPGCSLTLKNVAPRVDNPSARQMFFINDDATLIIGENVRFNGEAAVWLANNANPIEMAAPLDMGPMYINTVSPPTLVEGKVLVHTNGFLTEPVEDYFVLNVTNRVLRLESNGDLTVQRGAGSLTEVYVSTTVTGATPASDDNEGDAPARAVLTYAKAVSLLGDDGVIYVCNGAWNLDTAFGGGAIFIKDVTIKRSPTQAAGYSFAVSTALFTWTSATAKTVTVEDSFIDNNNGNTVFGASSDLTIRRSEITGNAGVVISHTSGSYPIRIEESVITTSGPTAINYYYNFYLDAVNTEITGALFCYREAVPSIKIISDAVAQPFTINYSTRTPAVARNLVEMENGSSIEPYASYFNVQVAAGYDVVAVGVSIYANPSGAVYVNEAEGAPIGRGNTPNAPVTFTRALELVDELAAVTDIFVMVDSITLTTPMDVAITKSGVSIQKYTSFANPLFVINAGGSLGLENVTVSGANGLTSSTNGMVFVNGGTLRLGSGAVLTDNGNYRTLVINAGTVVLDGGAVVSSSTSYPAVWLSGGLFDLQSGTVEASGGGGALRVVTTGQAKLYEDSNVLGTIFCSVNAGVIPLIAGGPMPTRVFDVDFDGSMYGRTLVDGTGAGAYPADVGNYYAVDPDLHVALEQDGADVSIGQETIIYLNGTAAGNDAYDGLSPATAVRTFAKAKEILVANKDDARLIYITGLVTISGAEVWDLTEVPAAVVKRFSTLSGQLITVPYNGSLTLSNITIDGNAEDLSYSAGAVVYVYGGRLTMENGAVVRNNSGYWNIYAVPRTVSSVLYTPEFTINGGEVRDAKCVDHGNSTNANTGNICATAGLITMNGGAILNGDSKLSGGAGGVRVTGDGTVFIMNDGLISGNSGYYSGSGYTGGGVYITALAEFTMYGGEISDNGAAGGAGVFINTNGTFNLYDGEIKGNHGWLNPETGAVGASTGTGVRVGPRSGEGAATFNMYGGTIYDNVGASGAGVGSVGTLAVFNMTGGTVSGNTGTTGGGVTVTGTFVMQPGATVAHNTGSSNGGGVYNTGTTTLYGGAISGNTSGGAGGGVYSSGTFTLHNGEIISNISTSANGGGGLYIAGGAAALQAGLIAYNTLTTATTGYGGGVRLNSATATLTINGGTITNNTSTAYGGGLSVLGTCVMNGGEISDNTANASYSGNVIGGGVFVQTGSFDLYGGEIKNNRVNYFANTNGGGGVGVGNANNSVAIFNMYGGLISGNEAAIGGGVRIRYNLATFTIHGGEISDNTAVSYAAAGTGRGGGVYLTDGTFNILGGLITGNAQQDPPTTSSAGITTDNTGEVDYTSGAINISEGDCRITGNIFIRTLPGANFNSTPAAGSYLLINDTVTNAAQRYKVYLNQGTTAANYNQATGNGRIVVEPAGGLSSVAVYLNNFVLANPVGSSFIAMSNSATLNTVIAIGPAAIRFIDGTAAPGGDGIWPDSAWNSLADPDLLAFIADAQAGTTNIIFIVGQITIPDLQSIITPPGMNISFRRYSGFAYAGHIKPAYGGDLFKVVSGGALTLENVSISGGDTDFVANSVTTPVTGSVVQIDAGGLLELKSAAIADAKSTADGVGIYQGGTLRLTGEPAVGCEVYLPTGKVIESTVAALGIDAVIEDIRLETPVDGAHVVVYPAAFPLTELTKYALHSSQSDRYVLVQNGLRIELKENVRVLNYNANGAAGLTVPATQRVLIVDGDAEATIAAPTIPGTAGYKFLGWATSNTATTPDFAYDGTTVPVSFTPESITLTAPETTLYAVFEALVFGATLNRSGTQTFTSAVYGYAAQTALSVDVENTGEINTRNLTVSLAGADPGAFVLSTTTLTDIAVGGTRTNAFTVRSATGLNAGTYTATVTVANENIGPLSFNVSFTVTKATVTAANILVTAPVKLESPDPVADTPGEGFILSEVMWSPTDDPFACATAYTATVTLTADGNHSFGLTSQTINGVTAAVSGDANEVTLTYTFAATAARAVAGIAVKAQPTTLVYAYGDALDLTGLVVTLTYDDSTTEDVTLSGFGTYSISTSPANAATLTISGNDGAPVALSCGAFTAYTANLTVHKATGAAVGTPVVNGTPTPDSIAVAAVALQTATGQSLQYAISTDGAAAPAALLWQSGVGFSGLLEGTTYYVYARSASDANYDAGVAQVSAGITTAWATYAVTYALNGGAGAAPTETAKAAGDTFGAAASAGLTAPTGQQFKEWNTAADGSGTAYAPGATVTMPGAALNLYAIWEALTAYGIALDLAGTYTFPAASRNYGAQGALPVTVLNTGNQATGALTVALSGADAACFLLSAGSVGSIVAGGFASFTVVPVGGLTAGTYAATVTVSGDNGITASFDLSFTVKGAGGSSGGGSPPTQTDPPTPEPVPTPAPGSTPGSTPSTAAVLVDGREIDAGEVQAEGAITRVTLHQEGFSQEMANAQENVLVVVPSGAITAEAELVVKNVEDMAAKGMTLTVKSGDVRYNIPAAAVNTAFIMETLGAADPQLVPVSVSITAYRETPAFVQAVLGQTDVVLVLPPVAFNLTALYNGNTVEVTEFSQYVSRTVQLTAEQAQNVTTAVVVEPDAAVRHVPTYVFQEDGNWYATINSLTNSVYALIYREEIFSDASGKWYEAAVNEMGSRVIVTGVGDGRFEGDRSVTRAEFAAILIRALGLPPRGDGVVFRDVPDGAWYYGAVGKAYEYGLVDGVGAGLFAPDQPLTRQEAMALVWRAARLAGFAGSEGKLDDFSDAGQVSAWALEAARWNVGADLIVGSNGQLRPNENISRAEAATLTLHLLQKAGLVDERN